MAIPSIRGRAVHIKFNPRPYTISESTNVLKILERYGEVEYFRSLQYEPIPARNSAVAIYRYQDSATKACKASPVRFRYGESSEKAREYGLHATDLDNRVPAQAASNATFDEGNAKSTSWIDDDASSGNAHGDKVDEELNASGNIATSLSSSFMPEHTNKAKDHHRPGREVHLQISASTLNHDLYLKRQFYHQQWKPNIRTVMARDLEKKTPIPHLGNFELYKGEVLGSIRKKRDDNPPPSIPRLGLLWQQSKGQAKKMTEKPD